MNLEWPGASQVQQRAFRRLFVRLSRPVPQGAEIVTAYTDGQVTLRSNRGKERYHEAADLSSYQGVEPGDFVVHGLDIMRGSVGVSDSRGAMSPVCIVCRPTKLAEPRYMAYAMRLQAASDYPKALARGVRDGGADFRRWDTLADLPLPAPPVAEQRAIADFLDRETAKIDALIEKQNQLVGLLRERRESVVESVLRNAGPTGALGFFAHCLPGYAFAAQDFSQDEQDVRLLRGINVKPRATDWSEVVYWPQEAAVAFSSYQLVAGDIVLGMDRPFVGDGTRVAVIDEGDLPCLLLQRVLRVRPRAQVSSKFLYFALMTRSFREYATPEFTGVSVPHISDKQVRSFRLPVPDLGEQENLAARVGADVAKIDALIAKAEEFIALAKERRAALITAAVTGQIDVLGEAS